MLMRVFATGALLFLIFMTGSLAATKGEEDACERDVMRLCRRVINEGEFTILACLKEKRARISRACDKVLKSHGQ